MLTGSISPTGIPLPFISAGGSSLMVFMASVGFRDDLFADGIKIDPEKLTFEIEQLERDECWKVLEEYDNMEKQLY